VVPEQPRRYPYAGPADIAAAVTPDAAGRPVRSPAEFAAWAASVPARELAEPFTYVVDLAGVLRLAPRRSEHVACAVCAGELPGPAVSVVPPG
jgi:hypothetical protein